MKSRIFQLSLFVSFSLFSANLSAGPGQGYADWAPGFFHPAAFNMADAIRHMLVQEREVILLEELCESDNDEIDCALEEPLKETQNDEQPMVAPVAKHKTAICTLYLKGKCKRVLCNFAHGQEELTRRPSYKTKLCRRFNKQRKCPYGENCQYAHGKDELKRQ